MVPVIKGMCSSVVTHAAKARAERVRESRRCSAMTELLHQLVGVQRPILARDVHIYDKHRLPPGGIPGSGRRVLVVGPVNMSVCDRHSPCKRMVPRCGNCFADR
jgi:hypothetical protein